MGSLSLTSLDAVAFTVLALSAAWGLIRGFLTEACALLAWTGAIIAAFWFHPLVFPYVASHLSDHTVATGVSFVLTFFASLVALSLAGNALAKAVRLIVPRMLDWLMGAAFGLVRGYVVLVVGYIGLHTLAHGWLDDMTSGTRTGPYIARGAAYLLSQGPQWLPQGVRQHLPGT